MSGMPCLYQIVQQLSMASELLQESILSCLKCAIVVYQMSGFEMVNIGKIIRSFVKYTSKQSSNAFDFFLVSASSFVSSFMIIQQKATPYVASSCPCLCQRISRPVQKSERK